MTLRDYNLVSVEEADLFMSNMIDDFANWNDFTEDQKRRGLSTAWRTILNDSTIIFKYSIEYKKYKDHRVFEAVILQAYHMLTDHEAQYAEKNAKNGNTSIGLPDYSASFNKPTQLYPSVYETLIPCLVRVGRL